MVSFLKYIEINFIMINVMIFYFSAETKGAYPILNFLAVHHPSDKEMSLTLRKSAKNKIK